ncbi:MAG: EMC3/TMCO1 family protein [Nitrososphaerales archaeon]|nr:EMC3/TMCO1 family protein [Nitrososphaerales archaeon]
MSLLIPDSTLVLTLTAVGFGLISNLLTRRFVNLEAERRIKAEINDFTKAMKAAVKSGNKQEQEKLKKKEPSINKMRMKMSSARSRVALYTIVPFFAIYYLVLFLVGNVPVAYMPFGIPYICWTPPGGSACQVLANGATALNSFGWYLISSFSFSGMLTKLLKTQT